MKSGKTKLSNTIDLMRLLNDKNSQPMRCLKTFHHFSLTFIAVSANKLLFYILDLIGPSSQDYHVIKCI